MVHHGDEGTQDLEKDIRAFEDHLTAMHGDQTFCLWRDDRRQMIMSLPAIHGRELFDAFQIVAMRHTTQCKLTSVLIEMCKRKWQCVQAKLATALGEVYVPSKERWSWADEEQEYEKKYAKLDQWRRNMDQNKALCNNPGRAWRSGHAKHVTNAGDHQMYPENRFGTEPPPKRGRKQNGMKIGEEYNSPDDPWWDMMNSPFAVETGPGKFKGFSHTTKLPMLQGGCQDSAGYAWLPTTNEIDMDRLYQALREAASIGLIDNVWPWGIGRQDEPGKTAVYKKDPWLHLNPYKLLVTLPNEKWKFEVGSTDNKKPGALC